MKSKSEKRITEEDIQKLSERLYKTHTQSSQPRDEEPPPPPPKTQVSGDEVQKITDRLYKTHTVSSNPPPEPEPETAVNKGVDVELTVQRLYTTHTHAMKDHDDLQTTAVDQISKPASDADVSEIIQRLSQTHTKTSAGGAECKPWDPVKEPGFGLKMYPVVEGIETRFAGLQTLESEEKLRELDERLLKTQTSASQARLDNPRVLLYPERTTLMNDVERIRQYQESGGLSRQAALQRREKWYN